MKLRDIMTVDQLIDSFTIRQLSNSQIFEAQHLLWNHFFNECKWTPPSNTPTQWKICFHQGKQIVTDRFDREEGITRYYGAFDGENIMGLCRCLDFKDTLDVLQYHVELLDEKYRTSQTKELSRLYVRKEIKGSAKLRLQVRMVQYVRKEIGNHTKLLAASDFIHLYNYCPQQIVGMVRYDNKMRWVPIYAIGPFEELQAALIRQKSYAKL